MKRCSPIIGIAATGLASLFACALPHDETSDPADAAPMGFEIDASGSSGSSSSGGPGGGSSSGGPIVVDRSLCTAGSYQGSMTGSYSPDVDSGLSLTVRGSVEFTLDQQGSENQMCTITVHGEGTTTERCSDVFTISGGTIVGVMTPPGDGAADGMACFCTVDGVLDCARSQLDNGSMHCNYCEGLAVDAGSCVVSGGSFAGPLSASYDTSTGAFVSGTWNGAELPADSDGGIAGPEGGVPTASLVVDGGYGNGNYGGSGTWSATVLGIE